MSTTFATSSSATRVENTPAQPILNGTACASCDSGMYRPASNVGEFLMENVGVKRLSFVVGYVFVAVATLLIVVGLIDLLGVGLGGAFPLIVPGATLGALAALMIQWGNAPIPSTRIKLQCDRCGKAPPS